MVENSILDIASTTSFLETTRDVDRIKTFLEMFLRSMKEQEASVNQEEILGLFRNAVKNFSHTNHPMTEWRDELGMTLLMNMVIIDEDTLPTESYMLRKLVERIITEEDFDDAYLNHKADYGLKVQFQLQHYQGVHKISKKSCTVISPDQEIPVRKIKKNADGDLVGRWDEMNDDQQKVVSKHPVKLVQSDGTETEKRIMITCNEDLDPEHFDSQSVASSNGVFRAKKNEFMYSESVSTKVISTPKVSLQVNKYFSKNTTLLLLASKTKSWNIVRAILQLDPEKYPTLFQSVGQMKKHPLYFQDDSGANCLHLAIEDEQFDIAKVIIDKVDEFTLKTMAVVKNKPALKFIEEMLKMDQNLEELTEIKELIEKRIGKKKQKRKGTRDGECNIQKQLKM